MVSFVALYRGRTLSDAELVGVSVHRELIDRAADLMLENQRKKDHGADPVASAVRSGRIEALKRLKEETAGATT